VTARKGRELRLDIREGNEWLELGSLVAKEFLVTTEYVEFNVDDDENQHGGGGAKTFAVTGTVLPANTRAERILWNWWESSTPVSRLRLVLPPDTETVGRLWGHGIQGYFTILNIDNNGDLTTPYSWELDLVLENSTGFSVVPSLAERLGHIQNFRGRYITGGVTLTWDLLDDPEDLVEGYQYRERIRDGLWSPWETVPGGNSASSYTISRIFTSGQHYYEIRPVGRDSFGAIVDHDLRVEISRLIFAFPGVSGIYQRSQDFGRSWLRLEDPNPANLAGYKRLPYEGTIGHPTDSSIRRSDGSWWMYFDGIQRSIGGSQTTQVRLWASYDDGESWVPEQTPSGIIRSDGIMGSAAYNRDERTFIAWDYDDRLWLVQDVTTTIYRSINEGDSFHARPGALPGYGGLHGTPTGQDASLVRGFDISPNGDFYALYITTNTARGLMDYGIIKSTDQGVTWDTTYRKPPGLSEPAVHAFCVLDNNVLLCATAVWPAGGSRFNYIREISIYRDDGST